MTETVSTPQMTDDELADWLASDEFGSLAAGPVRWRGDCVGIQAAVAAGSAEAIRGTVAATRANGVGWPEIAAALGVEASEARERYSIFRLGDK